MAKTDAQRLVDLKSAAKKFKKGDLISLLDCANLWGVTKPRFVNKRVEFTDWPDPIPDGNVHLFPALDAVRSMLGYIERHHSAAQAKARRQASLIGGTALEEQLANHTPAELATLNRLAADLSRREMEQGLYIPRADVEQIAGAIFSEISEFMSGLSNMIDPHGKLDPALRVMIDTRAHQRLMDVYTRMKGILSDDADGQPVRGQTRSTRKARTRRQG